MDPDSTTSCLIVFCLYLLLRAAHSLGQGILCYGSQARLDRLSQEGDQRADHLLELLEDPAAYLGSIQAGCLLVGFGGALLAYPAFVSPLSLWLGRWELSAGLRTGLSCLLVALIWVLLTQVLAVILPEKLLIHRLERFSLSVASLLHGLYHICRPLALVLGALAKPLLLLLGIDPQQKPEQVTEDEIRMMVDTGSEEGTIEKAEKEMINNIFEFDEKTVSEVMTHRTELYAVDTEATVLEAVKIVLEEGFSRIPVYRENIDDITGVLFAKDLLKYVVEPCGQNESIRPFIREVLFVPESQRCTELFQRFKAAKSQIAVVVDEYGGTAGIVTMEDLLEAIVGDMQDEYDDEEEEVIPLTDGQFILSGALTLEEVDKVLDTQLAEEEEHDTLGGYLVDLLDRIPGDNETPSVQVGPWKLTVLQVRERRILKVKAEPLPQEAAEAVEA